MYPPEAAQNGQAPAEAPDYPDLDQLVGELGQAVVRNAQLAAGSTNADESKGFAQAALFASQAIVGLVPYADPQAQGDKQTDNPAKAND